LREAVIIVAVAKVRQVLPPKDAVAQGGRRSRRRWSHHSFPCLSGML